MSLSDGSKSLLRRATIPRWLSQVHRRGICENFADRLDARTGPKRFWSFERGATHSPGATYALNLVLMMKKLGGGIRCFSGMLSGSKTERTRSRPITG